MIKRLTAFFSLHDLHINQILRSAGFNFLTKILSVLLGFTLSLILAREYGSSVIGIIALLHSLMSVALFSASFGFSKALLRLIPQYRSNHGVDGTLYIYLTVLKYLLITSLITSLVFFFLTSTVKEHFFATIDLEIMPILYLTALIIFTSALTSYNIQALRTLYFDLWFNLLILAPKLINLLLLGGVLFFFNSATNAIYANLLSSLIIVFLSTAFIFMAFKKRDAHYRRFSSSFTQVWTLSWPLFISNALFVGMSQVDTLMLGAMKTPEAVGIYHVSTQIAGITLFILTALGYRAAPLLADLYHSGENNKMITLAQKTSKLMFWLTFPIFLSLILGGELILKLFGETFISGYWAMVFLVLGSFTSAASGMVGNLLNLTGHQKAFKNILLLGMVSNIVLNIILIPMYGINGAAFASMFSIILWNVIGSFYIRYHFGYYIWYYPIIPIRRANESA